jgi:hypothetical protein
MCVAEYGQAPSQVLGAASVVVVVGVVVARAAKLDAERSHLIQPQTRPTMNVSAQYVAVSLFQTRNVKIVALVKENYCCLRSLIYLQQVVVAVWGRCAVWEDCVRFHGENASGYE